MIHPMMAALALCLMVPSSHAQAKPGKAETQVRYDSQLKQVYDVAILPQETQVRTDRMNHVLNVAAYHMGLTPLTDLHLTEADRGPEAPQIVVVLHGGEIALFHKKSGDPEMRKRASELHEAGVRFKVCRGAAMLMHEMGAKDLPDFIELVPGGEAEIAWLQQQGFGYNFFQVQ